MSRAMARGTIAIACALVASFAFAQSKPAPLKLEPSREVIERSANEGCSDSSVVVQRCPPKSPATSNAVRGSNAPSAPASRDELARSRDRTKAAFDRRDRRARQDALENKPPPVTGASADSSGPGAQELQRVTVTGSSTAEPPPTVEEVLQKALSPEQTVLPNGNSMTYGPNGDRTECQANCVGPMCCKVMRARPDPARESNSIGR